VANVTLPTPVVLAGAGLCLLGGYLVGAVGGHEFGVPREDRPSPRADQPLVGPGRRHDPTAGTAHPHQFPCAGRGVVHEERAERRHDEVEAGVRIRDRAQLALAEADLDLLGRGPLACPVEQQRGQVERLDLGACAGHRDRGVAGPGRGVEHPATRDVQLGRQQLAHRREQPRDAAVVALDPHLLDRGQPLVVLRRTGHRPSRRRCHHDTLVAGTGRYHPASPCGVLESRVTR
jgi:hypothetical protein